MTREEAKEILPLIKAFSEGKKIIVKDKRLSDEEYNWSEVDDCSFNIKQFDYRIKPEPTYRPFKNAEECWHEMQKHQPFGWVKLKDTESGYYMLKGIASQLVIGFNEIPFSYKRVFEDYTFADELTFGIKVEEEQLWNKKISGPRQVIYRQI